MTDANPFPAMLEATRALRARRVSRVFRSTSTPQALPGVPTFSPHDLRHRRISLLHRQGRSWAEIGAFAGQRSALVTSDVYTHVLLDDRELDYRRLLASSA